MRDVLKANIDKLETYFSLQEKVDNHEEIEDSYIYSKLKNKIRLKRKVKKEDSYIYYEISNLNKLFDGNLKIIKENLSQIYHSNDKDFFKLYNEYIILYKNIPFILNVEQLFYKIGIYNSNLSKFELPVFVTNEVIIYITENGVTRKLLDRVYKRSEVYNINSKVMREAIDEIPIKITDEVCFGLNGNIEIYYAGKLEQEGNYQDLSDCISEYLKDKYYKGYITKKDFTFKQELDEFIDEKTVKETFIVFEHVVPNCNEKSDVFAITTNVKKFRTTLTNSSKIKIVITREQNALVGKELKLKDLIDILLKNNDVYIKEAFETNLSTKEFLDYINQSITCNTISSIPYVFIDFENIGNVSYPIVRINLSSQFYKNIRFNGNQELLDQQVSYDSKKSCILLKQYYLIELLDDEEVSSFYIFRFVFEFRKITFKYGGKIFSFIVSCLLENKTKKLELFSNENAKLLQSYIGNHDLHCYLEKISDVKIVDDLTGMYNKCILQTYPKISEVEEFEYSYSNVLFKNEEITLLSEEKEMFNLDKYNPIYDSCIDKEYFEEILSHYKVI